MNCGVAEILHIKKIARSAALQLIADQIFSGDDVGRNFAINDGQSEFSGFVGSSGKALPRKNSYR